MPTLPGLTPPLVIAVLKQAQFGRELTATRGASDTSRAAENKHTVSRKKRGKLVTPARKRIVEYRDEIRVARRNQSSA